MTQRFDGVCRDGVWDRDEIEAVYGVHHVYSQAKSKDEEHHKSKADTIVTTVLQNIDTDGDGKVSLAELEKKGLDALPSFAHLGADGHVRLIIIRYSLST